MDGVLIVDKPRGITSHDVIDHLRRASGLKDVGHAGTLDPLAEGVLLCLLGRATRLTPYLQELPKAYRGVIQFGVRTDTQDADGEVFYQKPAPHLTLEQVRAAAEPFKGRIMQTPPMFSALRVQGKKLHELAREGKECPASRAPCISTNCRFLALSQATTRRGVRGGMLEGDLCAHAGVRYWRRAGGRGAPQATHAHGNRRLSAGGRQHAGAADRPREHQARLIPIADALGAPAAVDTTPAVLERLKHGNFVQAEHPLWTPGGYVVVRDAEGKVALIARWLPPLLRPTRVIQG
jgi:tRNA pseudouridine(55) synthase